MSQFQDFRELVTDFGNLGTDLFSFNCSSWQKTSVIPTAAVFFSFSVRTYTNSQIGHSFKRVRCCHTLYSFGKLVLKVLGWRMEPISAGC